MQSLQGERERGNQRKGGRDEQGGRIIGKGGKREDNRERKITKIQ